MSKLISIVVPIYNVEKYLRQCLESVVNQTYKNLEIILVDDGSIDNSGNICDEYAKKDIRIKVIRKENGGLGSARNAGLDICTGEYVGFVDSDDWIELDMYESLYKALEEHNVDVACVGYYKCYINKIVCIARNQDILYPKEELIYRAYGDKYYGHMVCNKLYKKGIFDKVRFPEKRYYEDSFIFFDILEKVNSIYICADAKYFYRQRKSSIMYKVFNYRSLDRIFLNKIFLKNVTKKYRNLVPDVRISLINSYHSVLSTLVESKSLNENYNFAILLQNKMRKYIGTILLTDKLNIKNKISYISLAINFTLYRCLLRFNKYIRRTKLYP